MGLKFHKNKQTKSRRPNPPVGLQDDYDDVQKKLIRGTQKDKGSKKWPISVLLLDPYSLSSTSRESDRHQII
ncbi:hypothetical protein QN277_000098 [Acacia crassicarpa]|uniref:Uncharacterized protein n=1 Tax=Acacia crassicarpa TaxID=499986 RepID=A0AAE1N5F2_9FABA|nr:hypothetical protein QN277_000098 [Acacia crassicarpa]